MAKDKRMEVVLEESSFLDTTYRIIRDTETGVQYLVVLSASGGAAVTPLLGADGKLEMGAVGR